LEVRALVAGTTDFRALLSGEYDHLPEETFPCCGSLAHVVERAGPTR
jgi:F0F1-type ATP synthase beta subunit